MVGDLLARSSWGIVLAASEEKIDLVVALVCIAFLLAGLYLLVQLQNYMGAAVAVILAILIFIFFLA